MAEAIPAQLWETPMAVIEKDREIEFVAKRISAIAHPLRLAIVCQLVDGRGLCVGEIVEALKTTQSNASQHLQQLANQGLLNSRRDGNRVIYSISDCRLASIIAMVRDVYCVRRAGGRW